MSVFLSSKSYFLLRTFLNVLFISCRLMKKVCFRTIPIWLLHTVVHIAGEHVYYASWHNNKKLDGYARFLLFIFFLIIIFWYFKIFDNFWILSCLGYPKKSVKCIFSSAISYKNNMKSISPSGMEGLQGYPINGGAGKGGEWSIDLQVCDFS